MEFIRLDLSICIDLIVINAAFILQRSHSFLGIVLVLLVSRVPPFFPCLLYTKARRYLEAAGHDCPAFRLTPPKRGELAPMSTLFTHAENQL